jgi:dihydroceramidase
MDIDSAAVRGYWGVSDTIAEFCEPKYEFFHGIAEFWNSLSSLIYIFIAAYALKKTLDLELQPRFPLAYATLLITGFGSVIFHLTMRYWAELADELPMLFLACMLLVTSQGTHSLNSGGNRVPFLMTIFAVMSLSAVLYLGFHIFGIFLHVFTAYLVFSIGIGLTAGAKHPFVRALMFRGIWAIIFGRLFWELEQNLCVRGPKVESIYWFHVLWHVFSALATYFWIAFMICLSAEKGVEIFNPGAKKVDINASIGQWYLMPAAQGPAKKE